MRTLAVHPTSEVRELTAADQVYSIRRLLDPAVKSAAEAHGVTGLPILAEVSS